MNTDQLIFYKPKWRPWREIALLMLMIMEVSWVVPWFRSLTPATYSTSELNAFLIFLSMMLAAHVLIRALNYLKLKIIIRQIVMVTMLLISILIGFKILLYSDEATSLLSLMNRPLQSFTDWRSVIPDEFIVSLAVIIGWWRGITLAQEHIGPSLVMNHFGVGIVMFFLFGILNTMVTGETPGNLLYTFFFSSLLAMASARMSILHTLRGGGSPEFDRKWFFGISFSAFFVVIIAIVAISFFTGGAGIFGYVLAGIFYFFTLLLYLLLSPIILLLIWAFGNIPIDLEFLGNLVESLRNLQLMIQQAMGRFSNMMEQSGFSKLISSWGPNIKAILFWAVLILAVVGLALWVGIRIWKERERRILGDNQDTILDPGELWKLLRATLKNKARELWDDISHLNFLDRSGKLRAAERIRQIYIEMMEMCNKLLIPRPEALTPIEFMPTLEELFPNHAKDIEVITLAYTRVRYGELPEQRKEVADVEEAWNNLSTAGELLVERRKKKTIS